MLTARQTLRLLIGVTIGVTFFGCVGLPRRRPSTASVPPAQPVAQVKVPEVIEPALRIPVDSHPVVHQPAENIPVSQPAQVTRTTFVPQEVQPKETQPATPMNPVTPVVPPPGPPLPTPTIVQPTTPVQPPQQQPKSRGVSTATTTTEEKVDNLGELKRVYLEASKGIAGMDSYIVRLKRNEYLKGKMQPQELILLKFRREPFSVHFKWLGEHAHGREVLYVKGQHRNEIHTKLAAGDVPFAPAGKRMSLAVDSALVKAASRHPITEAGIGRLVEHLGAVVTGMSKGDRSCGTATYLTQVTRSEFTTPVDGIEWKVPVGYDSSLPKGGTRWMFFDPKTRLPMVVVTHDERNHPVEYYQYDLLQTPVKLDNDDFDPEKLWGQPARQANTR